MNPAFSALCGMITAVFSGLFVYGFILRPKAEEARRNRLEAEAAERRTHEEARIAAEKTLLAAKEEAIRIRDAADAAAKEKLAALQKTEDRVCAREDALDSRRAAIDTR
ncbi:DUF3552 domain-containing protein, partial [bacterium]